MNEHRIRTALSLIESDEFKPRDPDTRFRLWRELGIFTAIFAIIIWS